MTWEPETNIKGPKGDKGDQGVQGPVGPEGPAGSNDWTEITGKPATFPPTLPIPQSGVTGLEAALAARPTEAPLDGNTYGRNNGAWVEVSGGGALVGEWNFINTTTAPPSTGQVRLNNASQPAATKMWVNKTTVTGVDVGNMLGLIFEGSKLLIQDKDDSTKFQLYAVNGPPLDKGSYWEYPVLWERGSGTVPEQRIVLASGGGGGGGSALVTTSDTPPTGAKDGQLWWNSTTGILYVWYDDGDSQQWVQSQPGITGPAGPSGGLEVIALAPSATPASNLATGAATARGVHTILDLTPTVSMVLTGIDTTGWETGKKITIRNATTRTGANARCIVINRNAAASLAANRLQHPSHGKLPLILMPEEAADFYFNGTDLKMLSSPRTLTLWGYFDYRIDAMIGNWWYSGTGAAASFCNGFTEANGDPYQAVTVTPGTTSPSRIWLSDNTNTMRTGAGAMLSLSRLCLPVLSTATDEYTARTGFSEPIVAPVDEICWVYNRLQSTNWRTRTTANSVSTDSDITGFPASANGVPILGTFINGDGTRAEFFYSNDAGATWQFTPTAHTTNIPTGTGRLFGFGSGFIKSAGTTSINFRVVYTGTLGWM